MAQRKRNNRGKPTKRRTPKTQRVAKVRNKNPKIKAKTDRRKTKSKSGVFLFGRFEGSEFIFRKHEWVDSAKKLWITKPAKECRLCGIRVLDPKDWIISCRGTKNP